MRWKELRWLGLWSWLVLMFVGATAEGSHLFLCLCLFLQMPSVSLSLQRGCCCSTSLCHSLQLWCSNQVGESVVWSPPLPKLLSPYSPWLCPDFPPHLHLVLLFPGEMEGSVREEPLHGLGTYSNPDLWGRLWLWGAVHLIASISFSGPARIFPISFLRTWKVTRGKAHGLWNARFCFKYEMSHRFRCKAYF